MPVQAHSETIVSKGIMSMEKEAPPDRRFSPRVNDKLNLKYQIVKLPQDAPLESEHLEQFTILRNISAGGILFVVSQPLPIGTILDIEMELLDNEEPIRCLVRVIRIKEIEEDKTYEVGACFLDLSIKQRNRILKFAKGEW